MIKINDLVQQLELMKYKNYNEIAAIRVKHDRVLMKKQLMKEKDKELIISKWE